MGSAYATVEEYREATGDEATSEARLSAALSAQSAKLRALCGIPASATLSGDAEELARALVIDACRKAFAPVAFGALGEVSGVTQASFTANGFQTSATLQNPSGSAYFDRSMLSAFKRAVGTWRVGTLGVSYGRGGA